MTARLAWVREPGAERCIDAEGLTRAVNRRWRRDVFVDSSAADILMSGTIGRTSRGSWTATIELRRADGTSLGSRQIETAAPDCSSLDDSLALAAGLMLDVSRREITEERSLQDKDARQASDAVLDGPSISIPKDTLAPRIPWRAEPSIGVESAIGLMPLAGVALRTGVDLTPPHFFSVEAAASFWASRNDDGTTGRGARWSLWTAELAVCPLDWNGSRLRAYGCVAQRFGRIDAAAFGFGANTTAREPLWTIGPRGVATYRVVGPLALRLGLGADVPLVRYRFVYSDSSGDTRTVYRMAVLSGSVQLGLALDF